MNAIRNNIAAEINRFHELACLQADEAIANAKQAGNLLLEAKTAMKHGGWLPWLEQNIKVSHRQAQRYMQVAQGRALPIRSAPAIYAVKNDKVSYLEADAPRNFPGKPEVPPGFLPDADHCYITSQSDRTMYLVEPSAKHLGYFYVSRINPDGESYDGTRRPVGPQWVEENLRYYGLDNPAGATWRCKPSGGVCEAMETLDGVAA